MKRKLALAVLMFGTCFAGVIGACVRNEFCAIPGIFAGELDGFAGAVCPPRDGVIMP